MRQKQTGMNRKSAFRREGQLPGPSVMRQDAILGPTTTTSTSATTCDTTATTGCDRSDTIDDCSTATADRTSYVRTSTVTTPLCSLGMIDGGWWPLQVRPRTPGAELPAEFAEALKLAGRRKVLRAPGGQRVQTTQSQMPAEPAEAAISIRRRIAVRRQSDGGCTGVPSSRHNVSGEPSRPNAAGAAKLGGQLPSKKKKHSTASLDSSSTSEESSEGTEKQSKCSTTNGSIGTTWPHLQAVAQELMSEFTRQGESREQQLLTDADLREALRLLRQKRNAELRHRRPQVPGSTKSGLALTAHREIEMDAGGDGPLRLTVCIPKGTDMQPLESHEYPGSGEPEALDADAATLSGVELCRDSTDSATADDAEAAAATAAAAAEATAAATAAAVVPAAAAALVAEEMAPPIKMSLQDPLRPSLGEDMTDEFHRQPSGGWLTDDSRVRGSAVEETADAGEAEDAEGTCSGEGDGTNPDSSGSSRSSGGSLEDEEANDWKQSEKRKEQQEAEDEELAEDAQLERERLALAAEQALLERRKELRERLRRLRAPLVSCPATVVGHLAGHSEQVDLARCLLDSLRPLDLSQAKMQLLWRSLRLTQPLRLNECRRSVGSDQGTPVDH